MPLTVIYASDTFSLLLGIFPKPMSEKRIVDINCERTVTKDSSANKMIPRGFLPTLVPRTTGKIIA
jgi:hypothetical protein